jgi:uncharacterized membrane protein
MTGDDGGADVIGTAKPRAGDGFIERGAEVTRLEAFVDAAFAFAVTLLVISIDAIPRTLDELLLALRGVPAFGVSFAMVAMFWSAHARWSRRYGLKDGGSTVLSLALVFLVLVYVYPLKMMFASFLSWISAGWLSPEAMAAALSSRSPQQEVLLMFVVYGVIFSTLSACLWGLYLLAWRQRSALQLAAHESDATGGELFSYLWFVSVGLLSVGIAWLLTMLLPADLPRRASWLIGIPGMAYMLLSLTGFADRLGRRWAQSRHAAA